MTLLEVKNLTKIFDNNRGIEKINFNLNKGKILGLLGNNGAGKTTTIKCIMNLLNPDTGQISLDGKTIFEDSYNFKKSISYIPDTPLYYNELTVYDHIKFIAMANSMDIKTFNIQLNILTEKYDVEKYIHLSFNELSKGTKQKILIIMALMKKSKLLIFDEPFDGLDIVAVEELVDSLLKFKENGCSIIISTHNIDIIDKIMDDILILKDSEQIIFDNLSNLKKKLQIDDLNLILKKYFKKSISNNINESRISNEIEF